MGGVHHIMGGVGDGSVVEPAPRDMKMLRGCRFESHCSPPAGPQAILWCHRFAQTCLETKSNLAPHMAASHLCTVISQCANTWDSLTIWTFLKKQTMVWVKWAEFTMIWAELTIAWTKWAELTMVWAELTTVWAEYDNWIQSAELLPKHTATVQLELTYRVVVHVCSSDHMATIIIHHCRRLRVN